MKKGFSVYTNYPIFYKYKGVQLTTIVLTKENLLTNDYKPGDLVIIDEAHNWFSSRNYKKFGSEYLEFFTAHGHLGIDIFLGVQYPQRIDTAIREIVDYYTWLSRIKPFKSILKERTYLVFEEILKESDMSDEERKEKFRSKIRFVKKRKRLLTSYNSVYLKDKLQENFNMNRDYYYPESIKYRGIYTELKYKLTKKRTFKKVIKSCKKSGVTHVTNQLAEAMQSIAYDIRLKNDENKKRLFSKKKFQKKRR